MQKEIQKIGKVLIGEGILTREEVASAIRGGSLKGSTIADLLEKCHHVSSAELAAFLASDDAGYITGQAINVCGGRRLN